MNRWVKYFMKKKILICCHTEILGSFQAGVNIVINTLVAYHLQSNMPGIGIDQLSMIHYWITVFFCRFIKVMNNYHSSRNPCRYEYLSFSRLVVLLVSFKKAIWICYLSFKMISLFPFRCIVKSIRKYFFPTAPMPQRISVLYFLLAWIVDVSSGKKEFYFQMTWQGAYFSEIFWDSV